MSEYKDLCQWLRDNSSGVYRKSAEAADVIETLQAEIERLKGGWISVEDGLPEAEVVVLIQVKSLGDHGVVSAWWCSDNEGFWVCLDDAINYFIDETDYWRPIIDLPPGIKEGE